MSSRSFVAAVRQQRLAAHATEVLVDPALSDDHDRARAAIATCTAIAAQVADAQAVLVDQLAGYGLAVEVRPIDGPRQHHTLSLRTQNVHAADAVRQALIECGYEPWERWTGGALASFRRWASHYTVARTDAHTMVVRIEWRDAPRRNVAQRAVVPTAGDWHMIDLPRWASPAYSLVRPVRLLAERVGLRRRHDGSLGPFLTTPDSLIDPLFEFAGITADDVVVDVGCGDGRLVVAAAQRFGCRAIGIEQDADLVQRAVDRAATAGVDHLVTISRSDARAADLTGATVVLMFLPVDAASDLLDELLSTLPPGGRLVMHEQGTLPPSLMATTPPAVSEMLLGADGVTVAHRWTAGP